MADWTNLPDTTFEPGAPAKGRDMRFLRDNPIAIAEGAPDAPRIRNAGIAQNTLTVNRLNSVSAGGSVRYRDTSNSVTTSDTFQSATDISLMNSGSLRVTFTQQTNGTDVVIEARVMVDNTVIKTWTISGQPPGYNQTRSVDVSFSRGSRIRIQHRTTAGANPRSTIFDKQFSTTGGDLWPTPHGFVFGNPA